MMALMFGLTVSARFIAQSVSSSAVNSLSRKFLQEKGHHAQDNHRNLAFLGHLIKS